MLFKAARCHNECGNGHQTETADFCVVCASLHWTSITVVFRLIRFSDITDAPDYTEPWQVNR